MARKTHQSPDATQGIMLHKKVKRSSVTTTARSPLAVRTSRRPHRLERWLVGLSWIVGALGWCGGSWCQAQPFDEAPRSLTVMTWNVEWMFDDDPADNRSRLAKQQSAASPAVWQDKLQAVAGVIAQAAPDIVALQEIEGGQTLAAIAGHLKSAAAVSYRYAFIQGSDSFTEQDVGLLVRGGLVAYRRNEQSRTMFESQQFYNLSKHLFGEFRWSNVEHPLTLLNVHLRATDKAEELRTRQARLARLWVEPALARGEDVIVLGDLNLEGQVGQPRDDLLALTDGAGSPTTLIDLLTRLDDPQQATHVILDRQFDRILVSPSLLEDGPGADWVFDQVRVIREGVIRGKQDGPEHWDQRLTAPSSELDVSDHFPVVATFKLQ